MKVNLKNLIVASIILALSAGIGCKKDSTTAPATNTSAGSADNYSSVQDFFAKNAVQMQTFTISGTTGGSFTTPQGTKVNVPANAFLDKSNNPVTGNVTIEFKDIYQRSDMLLSDVPTMLAGGKPLKSGGEFFIRAKSGGLAVHLAAAKGISVNQPLSGWPADNNMAAFKKDTLGNWVPPFDSSFAGYDSALSSYVFNLYQFNSPVDSGSWCNSDNSAYFSAFTQTTLTLKGNDSASTYGTNVFLVFHGLNSMVHVYNGGYSSFPYAYAPLGLQCTLVAIGVKNKALYSAFVPITIGSNQVVNFTLAPTTTPAFKAQLAAVK
jgi:hypothetical protein